MFKRIPTGDDIILARKLLDSTIRITPLLKSNLFSELTGSSIFLKYESFQKTGSFKVRGACVRVNSLTQKQCKNGVIAASAGNHAQGVSYAAMKRLIPCKIVMPINASPAKV